MVASNRLDAWAEVLHRGWEGMVAKGPVSPYVGGRTARTNGGVLQARWRVSRAASRRFLLQRRFAIYLCPLKLPRREAPNVHMKRVEATEALKLNLKLELIACD